MMARIFLSYARSDDGEPFDPATSFVARLHRDLSAAGFEVWFDRVSMPSRTLTFHQEIRDAVAACDRLVLLVGPKAAESLYVRQEWQFAYFEAEKIVTPILRRGDFPIVPDELKLLHCEDFRDDGQYDFHLKNLLRQLGEPAPMLGKLIGVPSLPPHFLLRTERLTALRNALRADLDRPVVITGAAARVGMHGMGGIGKSVLAATLSRDRKVREAFPDGIVWVALGQSPTVADLQRRVHKDLGGDGAFQTEHEGRVKLRDLLKDRSVLLILDDIWRRQDVDWFDVLGPRCRAMITTRDAGLLTSLGGVHHQVELLTDAEALNLVAQSAGIEPDKLPVEAAALIAECGRLPLAVALAGGMVQSGTPWSDVLKALRNHKLEFLEDEHTIYEQHRNLWRTIEVSVKALSADVQQRLAELAVFPEDEVIPEAAVTVLWSHTGDLDALDARRLLVKLKQWSLVQLTRPPGAPSDAMGGLSLHDLIYDYCMRLACKTHGSEAALHTRVLEAYRKKCPDGWHVDPPNDGYFFTHLRHHLIAAGRVGELADLLHELRWLEAKNEAGLTFDLTVDFAEVMKWLPETDVRQRILQLLDEALRRDIQFIARHSHDYPQGLFQCLWNSCWWYDCSEAAEHYDLAENTKFDQLRDCQGRPLSSLLQGWRLKKEAGTRSLWLRSLRPPPVSIGGPLRQLVSGHNGFVTAVEWSPDGRTIASGSEDNLIKIWDVHQGIQLADLRGHEQRIADLDWSPDGRLLASASWDKAVRLWDIKHNSSNLLQIGSEKISRLAWAPNGLMLAAAYDDGIINTWAMGEASLVNKLSGHEREILDLVWSPDSTRMASASKDATIRLWDIENSTQLACLDGHQHWVTSVAWSPTGRTIASASWDYTVRLWDPETGKCVGCLRGHRYGVMAVAWSPDGVLLASGASDGTVILWNMSDNKIICKFDNHNGSIRTIKWSFDGNLIASGVDNGNIILWDIASRSRMAILSGHSSVLALAWSPTANLLASGGQDSTLVLWDAVRPVLTPPLPNHDMDISQMVWAPTGNKIATGSADGLVCVWDASLGLPMFSLDSEIGQIGAVTWSPDGELIACGGSDGSICIWNISTRLCIADFEGDESGLTVMKWSPNGSILAGAYLDRSVKLWDVSNGNELISSRRIMDCHVDRLYWSDDSRFLKCGGIFAKNDKILDILDGQDLSPSDDDSLSDLEK